LIIEEGRGRRRRGHRPDRHREVTYLAYLDAAAGAPGGGCARAGRALPAFGRLRPTAGVGMDKDG